MRRSAFVIVTTVLLAAASTTAIAAHARSPRRTARLGHVRPDGEPVPEDDGEEHEIVPGGQTGKAPNAVELHPVIYVHLN
jgi:hypothetical protein